MHENRLIWVLCLFDLIKLFTQNNNNFVDEKLRSLGALVEDM